MCYVPPSVIMASSAQMASMARSAKMAEREKQASIKASIDARERRKLRRAAEAREREEANVQRRKEKAARQRAKSAAAAGAGGASGASGASARQDQEPRCQSTLTPEQRLPLLRNLGLTASQDTPAEIKKAFKRLALLYHPDKNPRGEAIMKVLNSSYHALI